MSRDVRLVRTPGDFAALRSQWHDLYEGSGGATVFQSHEWLTAWWRHFGHERALHVACLFDRGKLRAALPLQRREARSAGRRIGVLEFAGMPDDILRPVALLPGENPEILAALLDGLERLSPPWDVMFMDEVPDGAWFSAALRTWAAGRGLSSRIRPFHVCPYLLKNGYWQAWLAKKSRRFPARLRQAANRLRHAGPVELLQMHAPGEADTFVEAFRAVESRSWKAGTPAAVGRDPRYAALFREILGARGQILRGHAMVLAVAGTPVAATLGLSSRGVYYSLQIAHDAAFDRCSPGLLLEAREMEWFFDASGLERYEFLGSEGMAKRRWTDRAVGTSRITLWRRRLPARLHVCRKDVIAPAVETLGTRLRGRRPVVDPFILD